MLVRFLLLFSNLVCGPLKKIFSLLNNHIYQFYFWVVLIHTNTSCLACSFGIFLFCRNRLLCSRTRILMLPQYHYWYICLIIIISCLIDYPVKCSIKIYTLCVTITNCDEEKSRSLFSSCLTWLPCGYKMIQFYINTQVSIFLIFFSPKIFLKDDKCFVLFEC